jgi:flagellar hook-associated protein 1
MADLFSLLSNAASSLQAHQATTLVASHNMANANTEGYARQRANLVTTVPERIGANSFVGRGVTLQQITQSRDQFIERQMPLAYGGFGFASSRADALVSLTSLDPELPGGVGESFSQFFQSLRDATLHPANPTAREPILAGAKQLALAFNSAGRELQNLRDGIDRNLEARAVEATTLAQEVASLNDAINAAEVGGSSPNDLYDSRANAVNELATLIGAIPVYDSQGNVNMRLPGGADLVVGTVAYGVSTLPNATNRGHVDLVSVSPNGLTEKIMDAGTVGGEMGGVLAARDGAIKDAEEELDALAFEFADAINTLHSAGFDLDGNTGNNLFNTTAVVAGASQGLVLNPALNDDPRAVALAGTLAGLPGNADILHSMIDTENQPLASGIPPRTKFSTIISAYGAETRGALSNNDKERLVLNNLEGRRAAVSGVSLDEEMVTMTKAQRSYQAMTKVIQTSNEMLDVLLSLKR